MENASKALLIAAAVLIAIVLIALGIKLLNSSSDITESTEQTGEAIGDTIMDATSSITASLTDIDSMDENEFNKYLIEKYTDEEINGWTYKGTIKGFEVLELCRTIEKKYGSIFRDIETTRITSDNSCEINCNNIYRIIKENDINRIYNITFEGRLSNAYSIKVTF